MEDTILQSRKLGHRDGIIFRDYSYIMSELD